MSEEEKEAKKTKQNKKNIKEIDIKAWKKKQAKRVSSSNNINFLYRIKTIGKTLKFDNAKVNKKIFHASKQAINLNLEDVNKMVISDNFKHSDKPFKRFVGYKDDNTVKPLNIILPQMSGYIKYLKNGAKNMSFMI